MVVSLRLHRRRAEGRAMSSCLWEGCVEFGYAREGEEGNGRT
jgi:hypothetical protein